MIVSSVKWLETFPREVATVAYWIATVVTGTVASVAYCHKEKTFDGEWEKLNLPVFELILKGASIWQVFLPDLPILSILGGFRGAFKEISILFCK